MGIDPISPISPARVKALLLPVGKIRKTTFKDAVARLLPENVVRLGDISPDNKPGKTTFSPQAYPNGSIIYDLSTRAPPPHHASLSPFETFRAPFVVLGIADGSRINTTSTDAADDTDDTAQRTVEGLRRDLHDVSSEIAGVISTQLLIFNINETLSASPGVIHVPTRSQSRSTTIKTVMCDVSAAFLGDLAEFARDIQSWSDVETPSTAGLNTSTNNWQSDLSRQETGSANSRPNSPESDMSASRSSQRPVTIAAMNHTISNTPNSNSRPSTPQDPTSNSTTKSSSDAGLVRTSTIDQRLGAPLPSRPNSVSRESSRDRRSILHSSSSNATERARIKLKARQGVILGTLHLQSGRWSDALRELVDAATKAQTVNDHVWFAKGLENILATLLLLAWSGSDFQIPRICLPNPPKSKQSSIPENSKFIEHIGSHSLGALPPILPELVQMILNSYSRGANFQGEALLPFPYSECVIRLCYILSLLCRSNGSLDLATVKSMVLGNSLPHGKTAPSSDNIARISRREVATLLFRAYPNPPIIGSVATLDATIIFSGIASVLSHLKLERKRAMILRNLLTMLVPSMIQARKVGAAEVGIHPAASLAAAQSISASARKSQDPDKFSLEKSLHNLMHEVCQIYGVDFGQNPAPESSSNVNGESKTDSDLEEVIARFWKRTAGYDPVQVDILQLCVNLADAIPNFQDVTYFASALLRTVGPDEVAEMPFLGLASLAKEEQLRLRSRIMRTHGMKIHCDVDYWDDFLLRDLRVFESNPQQRVMSFNKKDIAGYSGSTHDAAALATGPFLHNPFLKNAAEIEAKNVIVAGETTEFIITVQNPYEFEITLENISLVFDGVPFKQKPQGITIGPNKAQRVVITAVAEAEGDIKVHGCNIKVQGCREKFFHVFPRPWRPHPDVKVKIMQSPSNVYSPQEVLAQVPESYLKEMRSALSPAVLELQVIPQQPYLELSATSLSQSAITLLEGETRYFTVTVRNTSGHVVVDFANLAFEHSPKVWVVQGTRTSADAAAIYEAEYIATHRPPFKWIKQDNLQTKIPPGETAIFTIAVFGRMGLSEGIVQIDYANIGGPLESVEGKVHTRRLLIPVSVTVSASVFLQRVDVIPLRNSELESLGGHLNSTQMELHRDKLDAVESSHSPDIFLLVMDFKNSWSKPLSIRTLVDDSEDDVEDGEFQEKSRKFVTEDVLEPDRITRVVATCPKLSVLNPHRPIPPPASARNSQYLFDANKGNEDDLSALRSFWYRQKLLSTVEITWKQPGSKREGIVDLRGITLTPAMATAIQRDALEIDICLSNTETGSHIERAKDGTYSVASDDFLTMTLTLVNRSSHELRPFLSINPKLSHRPRGAPIDLAKRVAWTGQLRGALQVVEPGDSTEQVMGWSIMSPGHYEIEIIVDKYQPRSRASFSNPGPSNHLGRAVCSIISRSDE